MYATAMGLALIDIYLLGCSDSSPDEDCYPLLNFDDPILLNTLEWIGNNKTLHLPDGMTLQTAIETLFAKYNIIPSTKENNHA